MCLDDKENQWNVLRKMRHDLCNMYILELAYLENERYEELHELYVKAIGKLEDKGYCIETGNLAIDATINFKVGVLKELHAQIRHDIKVQGEIRIDSSDLNILLGNLFDNVIDALKRTDENRRKTEFRLCTDETAFLFEIRNTFDGTVCRNENREIVTSKPDKENHGIGLAAVSEIVERYNGNLELDIQKNVFSVKVFLYMEI